jgi:hypothetical protein
LRQSFYNDFRLGPPSPLNETLNSIAVDDYLAGRRETLGVP